jgi:hypothetical protein
MSRRRDNGGETDGSIKPKGRKEGEGLDVRLAAEDSALT